MADEELVAMDTKNTALKCISCILFCFPYDLLLFEKALTDIFDVYVN